MLGKPKYKVGDSVFFKLYEDDKEFIIEGKVYIVDAYGTFEQQNEVSYDIMAEQSHFDKNSKCLYKHIRESNLYI